MPSSVCTEYHTANTISHFRETTKNSTESKCDIKKSVINYMEGTCKVILCRVNAPLQYSIQDNKIKTKLKKTKTAEN